MSEANVEANVPTLVLNWDSGDTDPSVQEFTENDEPLQANAPNLRVRIDGLVPGLVYNVRELVSYRADGTPWTDGFLTRPASYDHVRFWPRSDLASHFDTESNAARLRYLLDERLSVQPHSTRITPTNYSVRVVTLKTPEINAPLSTLDPDNTTLTLKVFWESNVDTVFPIVADYDPNLVLRSDTNAELTTLRTDQ
eukprot:2048314-Pyramimonas_sp.AAC.2